MENLQPKSRSLIHYIRTGFRLSKRDFTPEQLADLKGIANIENSVIIMDDILDDSELRNNEECLYRKDGIKKAILRAELLYAEGISSLIKLMKKTDTSAENQQTILDKLNEFLKDVYKGQEIDLELESKQEYEPQMVQKYKEMVTLFTGGHIRCGLEIGQLLSNSEIDKEISETAIHLGIIRQICDDFLDYFPEHHEQFGDFSKESNRLPEMLFKKHGGDRTQVLELIKSGNHDEARNMILNETVRSELHKFCQAERDSCKNTQPNIMGLLEDFDIILTKR